MKRKPSKIRATSFSASLLQVRRAYEAHYHQPIPPKGTYQEAGNALVASMGLEKAKAFIQSQSNDPNAIEALSGK